MISTDSTGLTENTLLYHYYATAKISIAGTAASGTTPENTTTWVTNASNYPVADKPVIVFYFNPVTPEGVSLAAPAQLLELTFRDPYLKQFITDNLQTYPLINYDVSYVDKLTTPVVLRPAPFRLSMVFRRIQPSPFPFTTILQKTSAGTRQTKAPRTGILCSRISPRTRAKPRSGIILAVRDGPCFIIPTPIPRIS